MRETKTPDKRRIALQDFFNAALPETFKSLPEYIHHIYILLDPISTIYLIQILERQQPNYDEEVQSAITTSLTYLHTKRESFPLKKRNPPHAKVPLHLKLDTSTNNNRLPYSSRPSPYSPKTMARVSYPTSKTCPKSSFHHDP